MRLCVCEWEGDKRESEDDAELHLQLPENPAGGKRVDAPPAPAD